MPRYISMVSGLTLRLWVLRDLLYQKGLDFSRLFAILSLLYYKYYIVDIKKPKIYNFDEFHLGKRLDVFLSEVMGESRAQVQKIVKSGAVSISGKLAKKSSYTPLLGAEIMVVDIDKEVEEDFDETIIEDEGPVDIEILGETNDYLVINKPPKLLVHPTQAEEPRSVVSWLLEKYPEVKGVGDGKERPGIVHRLDKGASGVLVIAKNQKMFDHLKNQFKARTVEKNYSVLVHGRFDMEHGKIDFKIDRGVDGRMVCRPKTDELALRTINKIQPGKDALTEYWVEKAFVNYALLNVKIHTGRTHQIRVHMLAFGHPVVGDPLYMNRKILHDRDKTLDRLFLHANRLCFSDLSGEKVCFESILPNELEGFLGLLT